MDITPLFAVDAEELLDKGLIDDAIELCKLGLEAYPGYPAGEAVLARCYKLSGNSEKANEILESAIQKNPFNRALETLKKYDIEIPKKEIKVIGDELVANEIPIEEIELDNDYIEDNEEHYQENIISETNDIGEESNIDNDDLEDELFLDYEDINLISGLKSNDAFIESSFDTNLELLSFDNNTFPSIFKNDHQIIINNNDKYKELASKIENVKIKISDKEVSEPEENEYKLEELVTETMANIFFEQGAYDEAIKAFKALTSRYPENQEKYNLIIEDIKIEKDKELELNTNNKFFKEQK